MKKKEQLTAGERLAGNLDEKQKALLMEAFGFALVVEKRVGEIMDESDSPIVDKENNDRG